MCLFQVEGELSLAIPQQACGPLRDPHQATRGKMVVVQRGSCMFHEKARHAQRAGAVGVIVIGRS